jgi:hypothetical protein
MIVLPFSSSAACRLAHHQSKHYSMNMPESSTPETFLYIVVAYVVLFPLFWCSVIWLIAQFSGWARLAQRYRATLSPSGKKWTWQRGMVGWAGYNGVLTLTANAEGLFMETFWLFGFGHPRLFIPWRDFREAQIQRYFFYRQVKTKVGFPPQATLRLPAVVFEESEGRQVLPDQTAPTTR